MATVRDVITWAQNDLGVIAVGDAPSADDIQFGLDALNGLVDQWAAERLTIYTVTRTTFNIVASQTSYTVGTSGNINIARPVYIDHVNWINQNATPNTEIQLQTLTDDAYANLPQKTLTAPIPSAWYFNPTFPTGTLYLWPIPTASWTNGAALYAPTAVTQFTSVSTTISLPPGYRRMLVKNLAAELGPSYARQVSADLRQQAMESKEVVKRANTRLLDMAFELGALTQGVDMLSYDIRTGP